MAANPYFSIIIPVYNRVAPLSRALKSIACQDFVDFEVIVIDDLPVALQLPTSVELEVVETDPALKGGSAAARTKPAILSTGLTVQVPEHIARGDRIKVNTEERKFMGRADSK